MGVTAPRVIKDVAVGMTWQASEGEAVPGSYTPAQFMFARRVTPSEGDNLLDPQGTHGSQFKHIGGRRINSRSPMVELEIFATKGNMPAFLEALTCGEPSSTLAASQLTETGDGAAQLSLWVLNGVRPRHNLEFTAPQTHKLYVTLTDVAGTRTVSAYKDAALLSKVAEGSRIGDGSVTLAEQNSSGLSGTVTVAYTVDDLSISLEITKIAYNFASQFARYFRFGFSDGARKMVMSDCVVESIEFRASENTELILGVKIRGRRFEIQDPGATWTISGLDLETYSLSELVFTDDPAGTPIVPAVDDFRLMVTNNVNPYLGNAALPQKMIKQGWQTIEGSIRGEYSDEFEGLLDQARAFITSGGASLAKVLRADFSYSGILRLEAPVGMFRIKESAVNGELVEKEELTFEGLTDGTQDAATITLEV